MTSCQGDGGDLSDAEAALVDEARAAHREPVWCHHCGSYSFLDEWADSGSFREGHDVCPVCEERWPASVGGPLTGRGYLDLAAAALVHRVEW